MGSISVARRYHVLLNVLLGQAKMAVWPSQRNTMEVSRITEPVSRFKGSMRLEIGFSYDGLNKMICDLKSFVKMDLVVLV